METNIQGLYAAGDCAGKPYQVAKSVGEGQTAALNAVVYLDSLELAAP
jgi:thioredoxin reductase (NADPH)